MDRVERPAELPDEVVVPRVLEVRRHPNADRLSLCRVDAGDGEPLSIVCGAPNTRAGKVGAVGFCYGGGAALRYSLGDPRLAGALPTGGDARGVAVAEAGRHQPQQAAGRLGGLDVEAAGAQGDGRVGVAQRAVATSTCSTTTPVPRPARSAVHPTRGTPTGRWTP
mgnify:CR=1 FL=1